MKFAIAFVLLATTVSAASRTNVVPGGTYSVNLFNGGFSYASGTWIGVDKARPGPEHINTVTISCLVQDKRCIVGEAEVTEIKYLYVTAAEYNITSSSDTELVADLDLICTRETIRLSFITQKATKLIRLTNPKKCEHDELERYATPMMYVLEDPRFIFPKE